jgi:putative endonuclease
MFYVYILQSLSYPEHHYIGSTQDLKKRLEDHNSGDTAHTAQFKPWKILTYHAFSDLEKAQRFERYLKTGTGRAFAKKHF